MRRRSSAKPNSSSILDAGQEIRKQRNVVPTTLVNTGSALIGMAQYVRPGYDARLPPFEKLPLVRCPRQLVIVGGDGSPFGLPKKLSDSDG